MTQVSYYFAEECSPRYGLYVLAADYARLEQEYAELAERYGKLQTGEGHITHRVISERDAALKHVDGLRVALQKFENLGIVVGNKTWQELDEALTTAAELLAKR